MSTQPNWSFAYTVDICSVPSIDPAFATMSLHISAECEYVSTKFRVAKPLGILVLCTKNTLGFAQCVFSTKWSSVVEEENWPSLLQIDEWIADIAHSNLQIVEYECEDYSRYRNPGKTFMSSMSVMQDNGRSYFVLRTEQAYVSIPLESVFLPLFAMLVDMKTKIADVTTARDAYNSAHY